MTAVLIANHIKLELPLYTALVNLGSGLAVGLCGLAAGFAIGIVGDAGIRSVAMQPRLFVSMVLILIFAEVLGLYCPVFLLLRCCWSLMRMAGLYGLIVALITDTRANLVSSTVCYAQQ